MSPVETLPAINVLDFSLTNQTPHLHENWPANLNDSRVLTCLRQQPSCESHLSAGDILFPSLPPLYHGHPDIHLRNGIISSNRSSDDHEPDSERAFFVADLSQVYHQLRDNLDMLTIGKV